MIRKSGHGETGSRRAAPPGAETDAESDAKTDAMTSAMVVRVRSLMLISGLTTLIAIAAVIAVIGYRVFRAGETGTAATAEAVVALPKGARVTASAVADDRLVVTLDVAGSTELRIFSLKTFKQVGRIRFATEP